MNKAATRLCALALAWGLGLFVRPALAVPDIADFSLGITREETLLRAAVPCGDDLCGEVAFGGKTWGGTFRFQNDVLHVISLFGPLDDAYVEAAFEGFAESPYMVYRAVSDNAVFDFPSRAAEGQSPEALDAAFVEFLRGLRSTGCTFASYFYTEPAVYEAMKLEAREAAARSGGGTVTGIQAAARAGSPDSGKDQPEPKAAAHEPEGIAPDEKNASPTVLAADSPAGGAPSRDAVEDDVPSRREAEAGKDEASDGRDTAGPPASGQNAPARQQGQASPDGVVCNLTIDEGGIVIIIMSRADLRAEMAARAACDAADAARKADEGARARSISTQKP